MLKQLSDAVDYNSYLASNQKSTISTNHLLVVTYCLIEVSVSPEHAFGTDFLAA